jgi:hypothetical protein
MLKGAQTVKTTQLFASLLRTLGPGRTPTGPALARPAAQVPKLKPTKQVFNVSGRFVRPGVTAQPEDLAQPAKSTAPLTKVPSVPKAPLVPLDRRELFQATRIEPEVAQQLPPAAPLATMIGILTSAASGHEPSRMQEYAEAIATEDDIQLREQQHIPIVLPDHTVIATIPELQRIPDVPLIGFHEVAGSRVDMNNEVALMPFYSGTVSAPFEQNVLEGHAAPTIRVDFNPKITELAPQGTMRITLSHGKDSVINDITNLSYLSTMIPPNYLPTFNMIIQSPTPVGMSIWHDTTTKVPLILPPAPSLGSLDLPLIQDLPPSRVQDQESLTPIPDLHEILQSSNLIGLLAFNLPEALTAPVALPAPAKEPAQEPTEAAEREKQASPQFPYKGYQRIIDAYKAQLALVQQLEHARDTTLLDISEASLIRIAQMLGQETSPEAMRMLREAGVDRNDLLSWIAAG